MYALDAHVESLWARVFARVADASGVALQPFAYPPPAPLRDLWLRNDLGCVFICGYPWATWDLTEALRPLPIAVPLFLAHRHESHPVYCTDIVVRTDSRIDSMADLHGKRFAYTTPESQSGYQAPRRFFADVAAASGGRWFSSVVGPLVTPRGVVDAVLSGTADVGPLDSYWHDLLRLHEPATAQHLRVIARTPLAPAPLLVCSAEVPSSLRSRLTDAFVALAGASDMKDVLGELALAGFRAVEAALYAQLVTLSRDADKLGYYRLQ